MRASCARHSFRPPCRTMPTRPWSCSSTILPVRREEKTARRSRPSGRFPPNWSNCSPSRRRVPRPRVWPSRAGGPRSQRCGEPLLERSPTSARSFGPRRRGRPQRTATSRSGSNGQSRRHPVRDHTDAFFVERVLRATADAHRRTAEALEARVPERLEQLDACFRRLGALFDVQISSFERKRFANLSHAPNKAMNLNAYIALMGTRRVTVRDPGGLHLVTAGEDEPGREFPDAPYVLTLDADSLLLPGYASRLIDVM